jgi:hypothetical protein
MVHCQVNPAARSLGEASVAVGVNVTGLSVPARAFCEELPSAYSERVVCDGL